MESGKKKKKEVQTVAENKNNVKKNLRNNGLSTFNLKMCEL